MRGIRWTLITGSVVLLASCTPQVVQLPPEQVLRSAAEAVQQLTSADFTLQGTFIGLLGGREEVALDTQGRLQDGGKQLAFSITTTLKNPAVDDEVSTVSADVVVAAEEEIYVQMKELSGDMLKTLLDGTHMTPSDTWWKFPADGDGASAHVTPDPTLLRAQAQVITVTHDDGIGSIDGRPVYRYTTAVDREKLRQYLQTVASTQGQTFDEAAFERTWGAIAITGTIAIDAQTFTIHDLTWAFAPLQGMEGLHGNLHVLLSSFNAASPIVPPSRYTELPAGPLPMLPERTP